jgi:hypothetical protein
MLDIGVVVFGGDGILSSTLSTSTPTHLYSQANIPINIKSNEPNGQLSEDSTGSSDDYHTCGNERVFSSPESYESNTTASISSPQNQDRPVAPVLDLQDSKTLDELLTDSKKKKKKHSKRREASNQNLLDPRRCHEGRP